MSRIFSTGTASILLVVTVSNLVGHGNAQASADKPEVFFERDSMDQRNLRKEARSDEVHEGDLVQPQELAGNPGWPNDNKWDPPNLKNDWGWQGNSWWPKWKPQWPEQWESWKPEPPSDWNPWNQDGPSYEKGHGRWGPSPFDSWPGYWKRKFLRCKWGHGDTWGATTTAAATTQAVV